LFQTFSPCIFFFSSRRKGNKNKKNKTIRKKNAKKRGNLFSNFHFTFSLLTFAFSILFLPIRFKHFLLGIFFFSSRRKERKTQRKKTITKYIYAKKGRSLSFFSCFYIWDEALLFLSPFHIPSTLNSPPSSSLMSHISSKLYAIQARELSPALEME